MTPLLKKGPGVGKTGPSPFRVVIRYHQRPNHSRAKEMPAPRGILPAGWESTPAGSVKSLENLIIYLPHPAPGPLGRHRSFPHCNQGKTMGNRAFSINPQRPISAPTDFLHHCSSTLPLCSSSNTPDHFPSLATGKWLSPVSPTPGPAVSNGVIGLCCGYKKSTIYLYKSTWVTLLLLFVPMSPS